MKDHDVKMLSKAGAIGEVLLFERAQGDFSVACYPASGEFWPDAPREFQWLELPEGGQRHFILLDTAFKHIHELVSGSVVKFRIRSCIAR